MEQIPRIVSGLVAAEEQCGLVHYYSSLCDTTAAPTTINPAQIGTLLSTKGDTEATSAFQLVYDVMRSRNGRILFRKLYAERFVHSLGLTAPTHTFPEGLSISIQDRLQHYMETPGTYLNGVTEQNVKIVAWVTQDAAADTPIPSVMFLSKSSYPPESMYVNGARFGLLYDAHRDNPNAKVAQKSLRDQANAYEKAYDLYEVLLVHGAADGYLVPEGSRSNYLLQRRDGSWWCSAEEDILIGITLKTAYRVVAACCLDTVRHGRLTVKDILACKALYMLGTSPTIMPIREILLYKDAETRHIFESVVKALAIDTASVDGNPIAYSPDASCATLQLAVDPSLAAKLRAQYFEEAAAS